jgi:hypothetical protein
MTLEQCARELANLLQSGQPPSAHQVSALINSCLRGSGARQMDLKRHQLAVAFKGMAPESAHRDLILRQYCRTIIDRAVAITDAASARRGFQDRGPAQARSKSRALAPP